MCILHAFVFVFFSSSWCRGLAADCDCCTPWTFLFLKFWTLYIFKDNFSETKLKNCLARNCIIFLNMFYAFVSDVTYTVRCCTIVCKTFRSKENLFHQWPWRTYEFAGLAIQWSLVRPPLLQFVVGLSLRKKRR